MAVCSSLCNPLSFISPPSTLPTISPPSQLTLPLSSFSLLSRSSLPPDPRPTAPLSQKIKTRDGLLPVIPKESPHFSLSSDLVSVLCPSLAYSNTLFFKSAYNVQIIVKEDEPEEELLKRFRRQVFRAGIIQESKRRRFFETTQEKKKRKAREASKRNRKRRPQVKAQQQDEKEASKKKKKDEEDDNWEFFDVELPYC
ncbi:unnamed protein product [Ilex paraguariensis]|uniref:Ribosomal protein S21 n=1 Tax=Ilex paraguariensis TaxID=185542 RepID=A0ABC8TSX4_9AQUA